MITYFKNVFAHSSLDSKDNKQTIRELSRKRKVIQSNMNANTIKLGIEVKSRQLTDPIFAEKKLKESLPKFKIL